MLNLGVFLRLIYTPCSVDLYCILHIELYFIRWAAPMWIRPRNCLCNTNLHLLHLSLIWEGLQGFNFLYFDCSVIHAQVSTFRQVGSSLSVCACLTGSLVNPSTRAEICRRTCQQIHLQTSLPTPQKSYPKLQNPWKTIEITPICPPKSFFLAREIIISLLHRAPCQF